MGDYLRRADYTLNIIGAVIYKCILKHLSKWVCRLHLRSKA